MADSTTPSDDLLMDLADALVSGLAAAFPSIELFGATLPINVEWCEDANIELSDAAIKAPLVWVLDISDDAASENHESFEDYHLLIVVQMKIPAGCDTKAFSRAMSRLSASIRTWARGRDTCALLEVQDEGFPCLRAERPTARNHDEWNIRRRFYSEILTQWRRY